MAIISFLQNLFNGGQASADSDAEQTTGVRYENLSGRAFKQQLEAAEKPVLLDVRTAAEYSSGSLSGAKNIDFFSPVFTQKVGQLDKEATYFVFCRSGNRSAQACKMMLKMGYDVRNLSGGIGAFPG